MDPRHKAYYNENDPFAAWLREQIKAGQSTPRLKGYGNGLVTQQAQAFVEAYRESEGDCSAAEA